MRRVIITLVAVFVAGLLLAGCAGGVDGDADTAGAAADGAADRPAAEDLAVEAEQAEIDDHVEEADEDGSGPPVTAARVDPSPRHIIYTVDLEIETEKIQRSAARAAALAVAAGGFVAHESTRGDDTATLTLRVPTARHSELVAELEEFGEVRDRSRSAEDVTAEVVDVEARIASQRRSLERIQVLLDNASDLADVIRIESELARREADLDSLLQRQERLSSLTSLATVTVTFVRVDSVPEDDEESTLGFLSGLGNGWAALVAAARVAGAVVGALLPFALVAAILGVPTWLLWRRYRPAHRPPVVPAAQPGEPG